MNIASWLFAGVAVMSFAFPPLAGSQENKAPTEKPFHAYAPTPPMGWNSWDCFGTTVTEAQTKENADYMAEKLAKHGWKLITVDIQWYEPNAKKFDYDPNATFRMDANGRLLPATNRFPSAEGEAGFKPLAKYVHDKGLTFGIHLMRGIPRQAVEQNTPILGTNFRAKDIANVNDKCPWNPDMFGVDMTKPGAQEYYDSVFNLIASWGVDFVKVDDLSRPYHDHEKEIEAIRTAIDRAAARTKRPMVLSMSPGETALSGADHAVAHANLWRISDDFWDQWPLLKSQFARCRNWAKYAGPGHWPDADMLALGAIRYNLDGDKAATRFTKDEQVTHMTLWCIARSPLIFGGHLPKTDAWTLSLLTNDEVLAVNQTGTNAREISDDNGLIVWASDAADGKSKYVALFNTRDSAAPLPVEMKLEKLGLKSAAVRDLWAKKDSGKVDGTLTQSVPSHGAMLFKIEAVD